MMTLPVLLLLALPVIYTEVLLNPSLEDRVPKITANGSTNQALPTPPDIEDKLDRVSSIKFDKTNLEWQIFNGSLPNGAVFINNQYVGRPTMSANSLARLVSTTMAWVLTATTPLKGKSMLALYFGHLRSW
ncbi:hypothetical protein PFLUV_G00269050 [Perca fluviatilis]|uniref:Uncharacterized protein n=1 Tax=Perca fluviatilis TaxID=8168 RepID=A0A6A5DN54_PERFL|nr:hypothetical protein PFLUV_G00269050 [Perca fluviatilis]